MTLSISIQITPPQTKKNFNKIPSLSLTVVIYWNSNPSRDMVKEFEPNRVVLGDFAIMIFINIIHSSKHIIICVAHWFALHNLKRLEKQAINVSQNIRATREYNRKATPKSFTSTMSDSVFQTYNYFCWSLVWTS